MQTSSHTHILKNETQHIWNVVHVTVYARNYAPRSRFYTISELKNKSRVNFCLLKLICYVAWILRFCIGKMWNVSGSSMFHHLCLLNSCFVFLVELTTILVFYAGPIWKRLPCMIYHDYISNRWISTFRYVLPAVCIIIISMVVDTIIFNT